MKIWFDLIFVFQVVLFLCASAFAQEKNADENAVDDAYKKCLQLKNTENDERFPISKRHWFLGFFEGRTKAVPPEGWSKAFLNADFHLSKDSHTLVFRDVRIIKDLPDKSWNKIIHSRNVNLQKTEKGLLAKIGDDAVLIEKDVVEFGNHLNILIDGDLAFVAMHRDRSYPYTVLCIDKYSSKVIWKSGIIPHPAHQNVSYAGIGYHVSWMKLDEQKNIAVFGLADDGLYVQLLERKTGKKLFHFSSELKH